MIKQKQTLLLVFATIVTLVLAVIAVITSIKLKEMATLPVVPMTVVQNQAEVTPVSTAEVLGTTSDTICQLTFTVGSIACNGVCTGDADCDTGLTCSSGKCRNPSCETEADCECPGASPTPTPTPSSSPTPEPPKCNIVCNPNVTNTGCSDGYFCEPNSRRCRNQQCPSEEDCSCPVDTCNTTCNPNVTDTGCSDGLVCEPNSRKCRNTSCTGETDCLCPTPSPTPSGTQETIPEAGNMAPGLLFLMTGGLLVILGVLAVSF